MADLSSAGAAALSGAAATSELNAQIVTQTLDKVNQYGAKGKKSGGMSDTYNFAKDVLSSAYEAKGAVVSVTEI